MDKIPKRRKYKDNPYKISKDSSTNKYYLEFKDSNNINQCLEIEKEVYDVFNLSELHDISEMNEYDRYIEHSELLDVTLYKRSINTFYSLEEEVESSILREEIKNAINTLPDMQKRRLRKYFFEDRTYEQIAIEEHCTKRAVKFSIDIAIKKISKILKK